MSRIILNDHPWSLSEIQYFLDRGRFADIEQNQREFPPGTVDEVKPDAAPQISQEVYEYVAALDIDKLKSDLKENGLSVDGEERDLKIRLALSLQEKKDASE